MAQAHSGEGRRPTAPKAPTPAELTVSAHPVAEMAKEEKPTIAVLGAGAMGCLFGGLLSEGGLDVTFVDKWQEHVDTLNRDGLKLVGVGGERTLKVSATPDVKSLGTFDVVIVQCKATDT